MTAEAAPVRNRTRPAVEAREQLRDFWASGRYRWAINDPLPRFPSIRAITRPDGTLRETPLVNALERRRDRAEARFDRGYFRIAPLFQRDAAPVTPTVAEVRQYLVSITLPRTAAFQVLIPPGSVVEPGSGPGPNLAEQNLSGAIQPTPVPEPSTLATGALMVAVAGGWWRSRRPG